MQKQVINPWTWQDKFGFVQAVEPTGSERVLYCSGQTSLDADGNVLHDGQMEEQALEALKNLKTVLHDAGFELADVVRLNIYVTDIAAWWKARPAFNKRIAETGVRYSCTLLGVAALGLPQLVIEIEATAAK